MINFKIENVQFNFRTAGITINNNCVLLHRMMKDDFWALPGGRCEVLEYSKDALIREYQEEICQAIIIEKPLFFVENFFSYEKERFQEISMIYSVLFPENSDYLDQLEFRGFEGSQELLFKWFPLSDLHNTTLYPSFLRNEIQNLPKSLKHILHKDN